MSLAQPPQPGTFERGQRDTTIPYGGMFFVVMCVTLWKMTLEAALIALHAYQVVFADLLSLD